MFRSILAVIAGYLVMVVIVVAIFAFSGLGLDDSPSNFFMILATFLGFLAAMAGGYVAAWIARHSELRHATALAIMVGVLGVVEMFASTGRVPLWFLVASIVVGVIGVMVGGNTRVRQIVEKTEAPA